MSQNKRPVGRPTKYNPELQARADRYIFEFETQGDVIPSNAGLCCWLGISRPTLHEWGRAYPEFSNTLDAIQVKQEMLALNGGMAGHFNATITKLVLANHGYSERQAVDLSSSDGTMTPKGLDGFYADVTTKTDAES